MKNKLWYFSLYVLITIIAWSCEKEKVPVDSTEFPEVIAFGRFVTPGCFGNEACVELFRMDASSLREDVNDVSPVAGEWYNGNYATTLSKEDHVSIEQMLRNNIPQGLLQKENGFVGTSPSWNTQYFYFEYKTASRHSYWVIDGSFDGNLGQELTTFINTLSVAVNTASF